LILIEIYVICNIHLYILRKHGGIIAVLVAVFVVLLVLLSLVVF